LNQLAVEMRGISKEFHGAMANDSIDVEVRWGEIHAIVGENGAGKTTLMKILYGMYKPDSGTICIDGQEVSIGNPSDAIRLGIGMVHQHFMLVESLSVAENVVLGVEPRKGLLFDYQSAVKAVSSEAQRFGIDIDVESKVGRLSVGMQQRVEILKALFKKARILILDEPTAVLTPQETRDLFKSLRALAKDGKSIILITHKLDEVLAVADRVTVLRQGKVMGLLDTDKTNRNELANLMVGREVIFDIPERATSPGPVVLQVEDISVLDSRRVEKLSNVSFQVRSREILGIAGVMGNGQTELVEVLTGLRRPSKGTVTICSHNVIRYSTRDFLEVGVAHIPEDRHQHGLVLDFSVEENLILGFHRKPPICRGIFLNSHESRSLSKTLIEEYDIRTANIDIPARSLSGGNQQKVVVARELSKDPSLIVASQPTRGLDVGAIEFVHRKLREYRDKGAAIVLVSSEIDELLGLSDRIAVLYKGQSVGILDTDAADAITVGLMMLGQKAENVMEEST